MTTRCKVRCVEFTQGEDANSVRFEVVTSGSPENDSFFRWTPSGELRFSVLRKDQVYDVGKEYYIDVTPANQ